MFADREERQWCPIDLKAVSWWGHAKPIIDDWARQKIAHTIPVIMSIDETFDVGSDTRTAVDDSYELPFRFTGKIDKLTFKLGPSQMTAEDQKAKAEAVARVNN